jgi:Arabinose-binding domain of AraC transcription regulator, N-term
MTEERIWQALPTVTGIATRLTITALKKQNVAIAPLLRRAGLSEHDFDGRQHSISAVSESKFLEYTAEATDDSAFGLHLAEEPNPRDAGLPFYVTSATNDIYEGSTSFNHAFRRWTGRLPSAARNEKLFCASL